MSSAFVKEGDQEEVPIVPARANLPAGVTNYVTQNGFKQLQNERDALVKEQNALKARSAEDNRVQINFIAAKLQLLDQRINSAKIVDPATQPKNEVRFGAVVTLYKIEEDCECQYQIVGVDEADASANKISFLSPFARVLLNKKIGEKAVLKTPKSERKMEVIGIDY